MILWVYMHSITSSTVTIVRHKSKIWMRRKNFWKIQIVVMRKSCHANAGPLHWYPNSIPVISNQSISGSNQSTIWWKIHFNDFFIVLTLDQPALYGLFLFEDLLCLLSMSFFECITMQIKCHRRLFSFNVVQKHPYKWIRFIQ